MVLSEQEFADHVKAALRQLYTPHKLQANPLVRSRLVVSQTGLEAAELDRAAALTDLLTQSLDQLAQAPRSEKYHRVLHRTFVNPVGSQEATADFLHLSFSTYRRYLKAGLERIVEMLWLQEITPK